jgi:hypothetical protein
LYYFDQLKSVQIKFDSCRWNQRRVSGWACKLVNELDKISGFVRVLWERVEINHNYGLVNVSVWSWSAQENNGLKLVEEARREVKKNVKHGLTGLDIKWYW